jgi:hypothetical protein
MEISICGFARDDPFYNTIAATINTLKNIHLDAANKSTLIAPHYTQKKIRGAMPGPATGK